MQVTLSVGGKFQAFHLAQEFQKHGCLRRLITTYFGRNAQNMRIDRARVMTNLVPELWYRAPQKIPGLRRWVDGEMYKFLSFDRWASKRIDGSDIVIAWAGFALATFQRARALGIRTILARASTHCVFQREILEEEYLRQGIQQTLDRRFEDRGVQEYELADYITVPTHFDLHSFASKGIAPEKIIVAPFGVDPAEFHPVPKEDQTFRVIFVGNGSFRKGLHYLLQAVHGLKLRDFEVWIIGGITEEMKPYMAKYQGSYRHIGVVPFGELYRYYSQGSVFVLPSLEEGMALVLLQAMACGLPIICTPHSGGEDIIRDGTEGFIVPIRDPKAIREKIQYLYEHEARRKEMAEAAYQRVGQEFSWVRYGERLLEACQKIVKGH